MLLAAMVFGGGLLDSGCSGNSLGCLCALDYSRACNLSRPWWLRFGQIVMIQRCTWGKLRYGRLVRVTFFNLTTDRRYLLSALRSQSFLLLVSASKPIDLVTGVSAWTWVIEGRLVDERVLPLHRQRVVAVLKDTVLG